jgi:GNAT superfamily N-acetyltransferase
MEVDVRSISYADILQAPNAQELINSYAMECSIPEIGHPSPQSDVYALLETSNVLRSFGVYKGEELIGFAAVLVSILPHYGQKVATLESIFVTPEHRAGHAGRCLMLAVEQCAQEQGCEAILYSAPTDSRFDHFLGNLDEYRHTNNVYCRRLN